MMVSALSLLAILAAGAIAVDAAHLYYARAELQTVADAAALAGVIDVENETQAAATAVQYASSNSGGFGLTLPSSDVEIGRGDDGSQSFTAGGTPVNAIEVTASRPTTRGNAVPYLFARLFGNDRGNVSASSVPVIQDGGDPDGSGSQLPNIIIIEVVGPATITIGGTGYWENELGGGTGAIGQLVG